MEAIRVRGLANGDTIGEFGLPLEDFELGLAVSAVETGTMNRSASILIQAGFYSRLAAIKAVNDTGATFSNAFELQQWLESEAVKALSAQPDWPTPETKPMWIEFVASFVPQCVEHLEGPPILGGRDVAPRRATTDGDAGPIASSSRPTRHPFRRRLPHR